MLISMAILEDYMEITFVRRSLRERRVYTREEDVLCEK